MMHRESLRHGYAPGRRFDSEAERQRYIETFERAREQARRRGIRYTVAPEQMIVTHDGRTLMPGDEVIVTRDFVFIVRRRPYESVLQLPVWRQLEDLVYAGRVIDAGADIDPPKDAA